VKKILITGANSYIGISVANWLAKYPDQYKVDTVDTFNDAWKQADFTQYDVVYHVAGIAHVKETKKNKPLYYKVNRDLPIAIAQYAKDHGIKQFIFMSSMSVYNSGNTLEPVIITKDTPPNPLTAYGDSKLQAEQGLQELEDEYFKIAILRPPMVYGPGCKGNFPKLAKLVKKLPVFPDIHNQRSSIYIDNLCEFIRLIIENESKGTFFPQNAEYTDTAEIVKELARLQGKKIHLAKWMIPFVYLASPFLNQINKMFGSLTYKRQESKEIGHSYQTVSFKDSISNSLSS
jgi:UDP-glucose 4-epimerase